MSSRDAPLQIEPLLATLSAHHVEFVIAMKVAAGRPQDEIDITSLERARQP